MTEKFTLVRSKKVAPPIGPPPKGETKESKGPDLGVGKGRMTKAMGSMGASMPPPFESTVRYRHKYYFYANASATLQPVSSSSLLAVPGVVVTTANTLGATIATSVRIRRIRGWSAVSTSVPTQINIEWASGFSALDPDLERDRLVPQGVTTTGVVTFTPPAKSLASFWINSLTANTTVFDLSAPSGSVIELDLEVCQRNNFAQLTGVAVSVTAAVGVLLYGRLDGPVGKFTPAGIPETG